MAVIEAVGAASHAREREGYAIVFAATVIWASTGVFISYLLDNFTLAPLTLAFWRDFIAGSVLFLFLLVFRPALLRVGWRQIPFLIAYGIFGLAWFNAIWTYSVHFNGASVSTVLIYTGPAWVAILSTRLFGERLTVRKIAAAILAVVGCGLVAQVYEPGVLLKNPIGTLVGVGAGIGFAVYSLFGKAASKRVNPWATTAYTFLFGSMALLATRPWHELWTLGPEPRGWLILLALAAGPTVGGYTLYMVSLNYLPVSTASLIVALEPAFTAFMAYLVLGEQMSLVQICGAAVILAAVVLSQLGGSEGVR